MSRAAPTLDDFDVIDGHLSRVKESGSRQIEVDSEKLTLGALAELLVLKRTATGVKLVARAGQRHRLLQQASKSKSGGVFADGLGAIYLGQPGEVSDNQAMAFGEHLARAAGGAGLSSRAALLLKGAAAELITNVYAHAGEAPHGMAVFEVLDRGVTLAVADAGQGVVEGFVRASPELAGLTADQALEMAVVEHRSRLAATTPGRGTGFMTVANAMRSLGAMLRVRSDDASLEIDGHPDEAEWTLREQVDLRGFVVSLTLQWC